MVELLQLNVIGIKVECQILRTLVKERVKIHKEKTKRDLDRSSLKISIKVNQIRGLSQLQSVVHIRLVEHIKTFQNMMVSGLMSNPQVSSTMITILLSCRKDGSQTNADYNLTRINGIELMMAR